MGIYTITEFADILGCSRTAIVKKIYDNGDETGNKRYKRRYDIVMKDGKQAISISDEDLEQEKRMSQGANNVSNNSDNIDQIDDFIDVEPIHQQNTINELYNFTERYINEFREYQERTNNVIINLEKEKVSFQNQIFLLEDNKLKENAEIKKIECENVTLKRNNRFLTYIVGLLITVLVVIATVAITVSTVNSNVNNNVASTTEDFSVTDPELEHEKRVGISKMETPTPKTSQQKKKK